MKSTASLFLCLLMLATAVVCGAAIQKLVLKAGDRVSLTCEEEPSLNREYTVTRDGLLVMPFIGSVDIAGRTEEEAAARIAEKLVAERIVRKATVRVRLLGTTNRIVAFAGAVKKSGQLPYRKGLTLSDVLALAQPTDSADLERIRVTSASGVTSVVDSRPDALGKPANLKLQTGDAIFVPTLKGVSEVYVLGAVARPGAVSWSPGITVTAALAAAGGFSDEANRLQMEITRKGEVTADKATGATTLDAGDRLFVPAIGKRRFVKVEGAVASPGTVEFSPGLTLTRVVLKAGGLTSGARADRVEVKGAGEKKARKFDLARILKGQIADPQLMPDEVVSVPSRSRGNNGVGQLIGLGLLLFLIAR